MLKQINPQFCSNREVVYRGIQLETNHGITKSNDISLFGGTSGAQEQGEVRIFNCHRMGRSKLFCNVQCPRCQGPKFSSPYIRSVIPAEFSYDQPTPPQKRSQIYIDPPQKRSQISGRLSENGQLMPI